MDTLACSIAIDHMVNKPYEVRGFKLDSDFLPVTAADGGKGDLYCEFKDFTILTEVTMSASSRQEAMGGLNLSDVMYLMLYLNMISLFMVCLLLSALTQTPQKLSDMVFGMPKVMLSSALILFRFHWSSSVGILFQCSRASRLVLNI